IFTGTVVAAPDRAAAVREWLPRLTHVGSGAARGLGQVEVALGEPAPDPLDGRLERFNRMLGLRWQRWTNALRASAPPPATHFALLLRADALLRPDGWTPSLRLEPELLGDGLRDAHLVRCYAAAEYRGGWNTAWGLPKDTELAARMGSVYLYRI